MTACGNARVGLGVMVEVAISTGTIVTVCVKVGEGSGVFVYVWLGTAVLTGPGINVTVGEPVGWIVDVTCFSCVVGCTGTGGGGWGEELHPESRSR
jgi:hypothetical protein